MKKITLFICLLFITMLSYGQIKGYTVEATDTLYLNGESINIDTSTSVDGQVIKRVAGKWTNGDGGVGTAAVDSLTISVDDNIDYWISGSVAGTVILDTIYLKLSDSTIYGTQHDINTLTEMIENTTQIVYTITLPIAGTLAGSIVAAVEGTDYPSGWVLTASGTSLLIEHNLGRSLAHATVKYNSSGTIYRSLIPYQTAYNTFQDDDLNNAQIVSISNYYSQYNLKIHLIFE